MTRLVVLCGGVGAARFLRACLAGTPDASVTAIVNVADDMVLHGLNISPDIDTITYTLADRIDPERGWGVRDEHWSAMEVLGELEPGADWFSLGDRDLGLHLYRTGRLAAGATLTEVTRTIADRLGVTIDILPVTDDPIRTFVTLAEGPQPATEISFQRYFVERRHDVAISAVRFAGADEASLSPAVSTALEAADRIVIAPSNPFVSIDPVLAVPGLREAIQAAPVPVIGISPLIGGEALKGPAARMMQELGERPDAAGVAHRYQDLLDGFVIDDLDAALAGDVRSTGAVPIVTNTIMSDAGAAARLAALTVTAPLPRGSR